MKTETDARKIASTYHDLEQARVRLRMLWEAKAKPINEDFRLSVSVGYQNVLADADAGLIVSSAIIGALTTYWECKASELIQELKEHGFE